MCSVCKRSRNQRCRGLQNDSLVLRATYETKNKSCGQKENCTQDSHKENNKTGNKKIRKEISTEHRFHTSKKAGALTALSFCL